MLEDLAVVEVCKRICLVVFMSIIGTSRDEFLFDSLGRPLIGEVLISRAFFYLLDPFYISFKELLPIVLLLLLLLLLLN